jgi:hypothetical protein
MEIVKKDIKYLNKDFGQFRSNLINFAIIFQIHILILMNHHQV